MAQITQALRGSHQYMGKVNGKTFVVPHGKLDIYAKDYYSAHSDDTITSREHVKKHNPGFSDEEIDAVHAHVNKEHQSKLEESMTYDLNESKEYRLPSGEVDHKKVDAQYKRNESQNKHMANAVLLAKHYGTEDEVATAQKHLDDGKKAGHNVHYAENSKLHIDLLNKMRKARGQKEIHEEVETPPIQVRSAYTKAYAKHHMKGRAEAMKASYAEVEKKHGPEMTAKLKAFHDHNEKSLQEDTLEEGRPMVGDVFHRHQTLVAKKTLKMHDAAVGVMGGMNKDEARAHLSKMGWTKKQIHDHEHSLNETGQLVEHGFVGFDHKGNRHEVEASSLLAAVEHIRKKANTPKSKHHLVHAKIAEKDTPEGRKQVVHTPMDEAFELNEASLTPKEKEKKEEIVKAMKKDKAGFVKRYGKKAKEVMHATATKKAKEMKEDNTLTLVKELIHEAAFTRRHFRQVADIIKNHPDPKKRHEMASHHAEVFAKSNPRFDKKRFFDAAGVKDHMNEQVEQIDEVSKDTLKSYVTKATADVKNYSYRRGMNDALAAHERLAGQQDSHDKFKSVSKLEGDRVNKRMSGILKAVKKINEASSSEVYGSRLKSKKGIKKYETGDGKRHVSEKDAMAHADRVHKATGNIISVEKLDEMVLHGHPWHKKSDEELHYIAKDAKEAMEAIGTHDKHAANKYADQMNDALSILNHRYVQKITGKRKG